MKRVTDSNLQYPESMYVYRSNCDKTLGNYGFPQAATQICCGAESFAAFGPRVVIPKSKLK